MSAARLRPIDALEQHGELVAAEPRSGVGRADRLDEAAADLAQHVVAGGVAEAVVDRLEVVEIEEDHRDRRALPVGARQRVLHAIGEQRPVRQARHGIVERLVGELRLERRALRDVAAVQHDPANVLVVQQVGREDLELDRPSVGVTQRALERVRPRSAAPLHAEQLAQPAAIAGDQQLLERGSLHLVGVVAEDALDRRALVADDPVAVDDRDEVARVSHERAEARLALSPVHVLDQLGAAECERHAVGERLQRLHDQRRQRRRRRDHDRARAGD